MFVLGGYLRFLGAPSVQFCWTLWISDPSCICLCQISQIQTCVWLSDLELSEITRFHKDQRQPSSGSVWPAGPKIGKSVPNCWGRLYYVSFGASSSPSSTLSTSNPSWCITDITSCFPFISDHITSPGMPASRVKSSKDT